MPPSEATSPTVRSLQGRRAAHRRWNRSDHAELDRDYAAAKLEVFIERTLAAAPPLTDEQCTRIAAILTPRAGERVG